MAFWSDLISIVVLLITAMILGIIFERFKQSAISGYLIAGVLLGPSLFNLIDNKSLIENVAELGVALVLFSIGLEFSISRLRSLGATALGSGTLQITFTIIAIAGIAMLFGLDTKTALAVGIAAAPSSTAVVMGLLRDRAELDSVHGRHSLGILLVQDVAIAPLVIIMAALSSPGGVTEILIDFAKTTLITVGLMVILFLIINYGIPKLLEMIAVTKNRELFVLISVIASAGATWGAHHVGLSPALGAFAAGIFLSESPFATQIRADISSFRALFATLFFCSIGMMADFGSIEGGLGYVALLVVIIVSVKLIIVWLVLLIFKATTKDAVATGLTLAQAGEFSFVLIQMAYNQQILDYSLLIAVSSATAITLFITPLMVANASPVARFVGKFKSSQKIITAPSTEVQGSIYGNHTIVIGFGPAGEQVFKALREEDYKTAVIDLNPDFISRVEDLCSNDDKSSQCVAALVGDATQPEILEYAGIAQARAVVVTVPDHRTGLDMIRQSRLLAPDTPVFSRVRQHRHIPEFLDSGVQDTVDEETLVGIELGKRVVFW